MLKVGERAPEFSLPDHNGRDVSLTSPFEFGGFDSVVFFRLSDAHRLRWPHATSAPCTQICSVRHW
jgi:peroxiredoxin